MGKKEEDLIERTVRSIVSKFGEGAAITLTKAFAPENVRGFVPTNNLALDWVIGRPGIPIGRISEIAGPMGSGKSSTVAQIIGAAQTAGMVAILMDTEHSYDSSWSRRFGVDPEKLILIQPDSLQGLFDRMIFAIKFVKAEQSDISILIAVDSISATPTVEELDMEDSAEGKQRAAHAKIISEGLRRMSDLVWDQNVAVLFVSQLKDNPGIMYGSNKSKLGGHAIDFHAGLLLEVRRLSLIKAGGQDGMIVGQTVQIKSVKNKFVPPFRECTYDLYYDTGVNQKETLVEFLADPSFGINTVKKAGGWYELDGSKYRKADLAAKLDSNLEQVARKALKLTPPYGREESSFVSENSSSAAYGTPETVVDKSSEPLGGLKAVSIKDLL